MRPFDDDQVEQIQDRLNDNYSRNDCTLDVSEAKLRKIVCEVLGITDFQSKANFLFWDCRAPWIGIEFKSRWFSNPVAQIGTLVDFTTSRTIDHVPQDDATKAIEYICEKYNLAVDEFEDQCGQNAWIAGALYSNDTVVYWHEKIEKLDPTKLVGEWRMSKANKKVKTFNLYVTDLSGTPVFTYLTKGEKLQMRFRVPSMQNVHVFTAEQSMVYVGVPAHYHKKIEQTHGKAFEEIVQSMAYGF